MAYFVYSFLLPRLSMLLAGSQDWFRNLQLWVDFDFTSPPTRHFFGATRVSCSKK